MKRLTRDLFCFVNEHGDSIGISQIIWPTGQRITPSLAPGINACNLCSTGEYLVATRHMRTTYKRVYSAESVHMCVLGQAQYCLLPALTVPPLLY